MTVIKLKQGDCLEVLRKAPSNYADSMVTDPPAGISFMGKDWDSDKGGRDGWVKWMTEVMAECLRVLKPGGHALVWAIPRTSHWTMSSLEDAGFEIRDVVTHLFGSGFPKSLDVSKAIDKATAPATPDAEKWQGFGTALKPACEFWILCRKPLGEKTVAANVLRHGTGALNIDGCRIGSDTISTHGGGNKFGNIGTGENDGVGTYHTHVGRFPANLVLSCECTDEVCGPDCAVRMLDKQSGPNCGAAAPVRKKATPASTNVDNYKPHSAVGDDGKSFRGDTGGASRFFYCAKASKRDKGADNTHPTVKSTALMRYLIKLVTPPGGLVLDPFMGSGSTGVAAIAEGFGFVGVEKESEYFDIASARIKGDAA